MTRAAILFLALPFAGCATVVIPPARLAHSSPVFIADYGRHSSLVLSRGDGRLVEYSFGQFAWYALDDDLYWVGHSCNAAVAEWLEELGCEVPSVALSANYEVRPSPSPPEPPQSRP